MAKVWLNRKTSIRDDFRADPLFTLLEDTTSNILVTGAAGTGKSTVLRNFIALTKKNCVVLAPTGIAATNVDGQTIHSFFQLPPGIIRSGDISKHRFAPLYKRIDALVIDEISMVRRDLFDAMDQILRRQRDEDKPFGGVKLVLFGDMHQLPPVVCDKERSVLYQKYETNSNYFFDSNVYEELDLIVVRLNHAYRQSDSRFLEILTRMQKNALTPGDIEILNKQVQEDEEGYVILSTKNDIVDDYNQKRLSKLPGPDVAYNTNITGEAKVKDAAAPEKLVLKAGARVICLVNDAKGRYFNGSLGTVTELFKDSVNIRLDRNGEIISLGRHDWNIYKYKFEQEEIGKELKGRISQIPLKLAWAMTVHKSQGQTLEKVLIDFKYKPWEHGQTYVAFSRLRSLSGLKLKMPVQMSDIIVDSQITDWENGLTKENMCDKYADMQVSGLNPEESEEIINRLNQELLGDFGISTAVDCITQGTYRISGEPLVTDFVRNRIISLLQKLCNTEYKYLTIDAGKPNEVRLKPSETAEYLRIKREIELDRKMRDL